ncbi:hypothetical protein KJ910_02485 [Patescibacteria group bacterium]|nr:hypothetical protein [Patescibacteria group bacterium]MBU1906883.1 hypothetical protein [Patescibacteria group bacterium]
MSKQPENYQARKILFWVLFGSALLVVLVGWVLVNRSTWQRFNVLSNMSVERSSQIVDEFYSTAEESRVQFEEFEDEIMADMEQKRTAEQIEQGQAVLVDYLNQEIDEQARAAEEAAAAAAPPTEDEAGSRQADGGGKLNDQTI